MLIVSICLYTLKYYYFLYFTYAMFLQHFYFSIGDLN